MFFQFLQQHSIQCKCPYGNYIGGTKQDPVYPKNSHYHWKNNLKKK